MIRRIASDHGLQAQVDLNGPKHKILAQTNQSDLAFLRDLARCEDAQIWVEGTKLKAATRSQRKGGTVELAWAGTLREFRVSADLAHQRTSIVASGWNVSDKEVARHEADEAAVRAELRTVTAARQRCGGLSERVRTHSRTGYRSMGPRRGHWQRRVYVIWRGGSSSASGVAETRADLRVGAKLKLSGLGPLFEGEYNAIYVHHRFDAKSGMRTEFRCDRPSLGKGR